MSASINTKKKSLGSDFLRATARHISGATLEYFGDAFPTTAPILKEAKNAAQSVGATLANTAQSVLPKMKQLRMQGAFRQIAEWYTQKEDEFDTGDIDQNLDFDIGTDDIDPGSAAEVSEFAQGADQISKSVIESSHQHVEAIMASTANIATSMDKQSSVIATGFDTINGTLNKILEVVTKNTATLIEVNAATSSNTTENDSMAITGKFDIDSYKKMVTRNINEGEFGMVISMLPMIMNPEMWKDMLSPQNLMKEGLAHFIDKKTPNFKKNMEALDQAINDTIMTSLIRIGEKSGFGIDGMLGRAFGIRSDRQNAVTTKRGLELKAVPFDSVVREFIVNAIPGYMRQMVMLMGGPDMTFDARSRSFRTKKEIRDEFHNQMVTTRTLATASDEFQTNIKNTTFNNMMFDLMMNDLGAKSGTGGQARAQIQSMRDNPTAAIKYALQLVGEKASDEDKAAAEEFGKSMVRALNASGMAGTELGNQVAKQTVIRNNRAAGVVERARQYDVDLSHVTDSVEEDEATIRRMYGRGYKGREWNKTDERKLAGISQKSSGAYSERVADGTDYTNIALYEIWRRLNTGINVFRVGKSDEQEHKFPAFKDDVLPKPKRHRPKKIDAAQLRSSGVGALGKIIHEQDDTNLLRNNETRDENGNITGQEELSKGERFTRWAKARGGALGKALFDGDPDEVRAAFGSIIRDVGQVGGDVIKNKGAEINSKFGNVTGYIRHKLFGTEYSYMDGDEEVHIKANEGITGFITKELKESFDNVKSKTGDWLKTTLGYFNFGGSDDDEDNGVASRRKKFIATTAGIFAGAGLLGGPLGLIVGGLAGNALGTLGIGKKIKDFLFGTDEDGNPTGLVAKAADAVISPIKFQLGKTIAFAGATLQKQVFGPLSDIGLALKDRITTHVDSIFSKVMKMVTAPFRLIGKIIGAGVMKLGEGLTKAANTMATTLPGKLARGAMSAGGAIVGGAQTSIANSIAGGGILGGGSYHKLARGESYTIKRGQWYYDPVAEKPRLATEDMDVEGGDKNAPRPRSRDYLKQRRKDRNAEVEQGLTDSGYYDSGRGVIGRVKGFFGKDYESWREGERERRKERWGRLRSATAEVRKTPEEVIAEQEEKNRKQQEEIAKRQQETQEEQTEVAKESRDAMVHMDTESSTVGSLFTHDQGIHDRLDHIIEFLTGSKFKSSEEKPQDAPVVPSMDVQLSDNPETPPTGAVVKGGLPSTKATAPEENDLKATAAVGAASAFIASDSVTDSDESRLGQRVLEENTKPNPDTDKITRDTVEIMNLHTRNALANEEEEETFWDWIKDILGGDGGILSTLLQYAGLFTTIIGLVNGLTGGTVINNITNNISDAAETFKDAGDSDDPTTAGVNTALNLVDTKVNDKTALFNPFAKVFHNRDAGDGSQIVHQDATRAKNNWLLYTPLKQSITKPFALDWSAARNMRKSNAAMGDAVDLTQQASIARMDGDMDAYNSLIDKRDAAATKSGEYAEKSQQLSDQAADYRANAGANVVKNIEKTAARVGTMTVLSQGAGGLTSWGAKRLGMDEESADRLGNYVTAGTTAGLMINQAKSTLTGKNSLVDNILAILKKFFDFLAGKFKAVKALQSFGGKIEQFFANIYNKSVGKVTEKIAQKIEAALAARLGEDTAKEAVSALGVGIPIAIGAISGIASGLCGVEHLFQVSPGDADATMKTISAIEQGVFEALEWTPGVGFIVAALDIIDSFIITGIFGKPLRQYIAEFLYNLIKGDGGATLSTKQGAFTTQLNTYNEKYGTALNTQTFNDLVNNGSWVDKIWRGGAKYDEEGNLKFDEAGGRIDGGLKGLVVGGEKTYVKDENGVVRRDSSGAAIVARDSKGNVIKADEKWGDKVGQFFNGVGRFFTGGDVYETDENGVAKVDENGNYIVADHDDNILKRAGDGLKTAGATIRDWGSRTGAAIRNGFNSFGAGVSKLFGYVKDGDINGLMSSTAGDENDDENPVSGFSSGVYQVGKMVAVVPTALSSVGHSIGNAVSNTINGIRNFGAKMAEEREYAEQLLHDKSSNFSDLLNVEDDEGNPIGGFMKAATIASRLSIIPMALLRRIGQTIGSVVGGVVQGVQSNFNGLMKNMGNIQSYISSGDVEGLAGLTFDEDPDNPMAGITHGIFTGAKLVSFIPTGISWVGHQVAGVFNAARESISNSFSVLRQNHQNINSYVQAGDVSGLMGLTMQNNPDNPVGEFTSAIFNADKFVHVPSAGLHYVGAQVRQAFEAIRAPIMNSFNTLSMNHSRIADMSSNGDVQGLLGLNMESDPNNPVGGFTQGIFNVDKFIHIPSAGLHWVGTRIREAFNAARERVANSFSTLSQNHESINSYVQGGDVEGLLSMQMETDPDNPVGGITNAIFTADKFIHVPSAGLHWIGSRVRETFDRVADTVGSARETLEQNTDKIGELATKGDLSGMHELQFEDDSENPLGGIMSGIFTVTKLVNYPRAAMHWLGSRIREGFDNMTSSIQSNRETLETANSELTTLADEGDVRAIWAKDVTFKDGDPLQFIWSASFTIHKLFSSVGAIFNTIGKAVGGVIDKAKGMFGNVLEGFWDWLKGDEADDDGEGGPVRSGVGGPRSSRKNVGGPAPELELDDYIGNSNGASVPKTGNGGNPLSKDFRISSGYGYRNLTGSGEFHKGVDLVPADSSKEADVGARYSGTVVATRDSIANSVTGLSVSGSNSAGNYFQYKTDDGYLIKNFHLKQGSIPSNLKEPGARVEVGDKIGEMGTTGRSTGPHLHYQIEQNGETIDPTQNVSNGATLTSFNTSDTGNYSSYTGSYDSNTSSGTSLSTTGGFINKLLEIGNGALNMIFGDLLGATSGNTTQSSYDGTSSINTTGSISSDFSSYKGSVKNATDFLKLVRNEIGTTEYPSNSNKVKYNEWFYGKPVSGSNYPWCMAFVQWCFHQAGLDIPYKTAGCGALYDWYKSHEASRIVRDPKPGDIVIFSLKKVHDHTGIVERVSGDNVYTIEGNTSSDNRGSQDNGGCVASKTRSRSKVFAFIRAVDFDALEQSLKNAASISGDIGNDPEALWAFLKGRGYSDEAIAGIFGSWSAESGVKAKRVEWDTSQKFKDMLGSYDAYANNASGRHTFGTALLEQLRKQGFYPTEEKWTRAKKAYSGPDGTYYPGIGYAQWTGPRAQKLVEFARKNNMKWYDAATQMAFMADEMQGGYNSVYQKLGTVRSAAEASKIFTTEYEGHSITQDRIDEANRYYKLYAGKVSGTAGMGGPDTASSGLSHMTPEERRAMFEEMKNMDSYKPKMKGDVGGPESEFDLSPVAPVSSIRKQPSRPMRTTEEQKPKAKKKQDLSISTTSSPAKDSASKQSKVPNAPVGGPDADVGQIVNLLKSVILHLEGIDSNTSRSSSLLSSLNDKDYSEYFGQGDTGTTTGTRSRSGRNGQVYRPSNASNTRMITSLTRP